MHEHSLSREATREEAEPPSLSHAEEASTLRTLASLSVQPHTSPPSLLAHLEAMVSNRALFPSDHVESMTRIASLVCSIVPSASKDYVIGKSLSFFFFLLVFGFGFWFVIYFFIFIFKAINRAN